MSYINIVESLYNREYTDPKTETQTFLPLSLG